MAKKKRPNYRTSPEALVASEHASFTPWQVVLVLRENFLADETTVTVFVRAPNPSRAMFVARRMWSYYVKEKNNPRGQPIPEWPQLDDRCDVICIADEDYASIWKAAQGFKRYWSGHEDNPIGFSFEPETRLAGADRF